MLNRNAQKKTRSKKKEPKIYQVPLIVKFVIFYSFSKRKVSRPSSVTTDIKYIPFGRDSTEKWLLVSDCTNNPVGLKIKILLTDFESTVTVELEGFG